MAKDIGHHFEDLVQHYNNEDFEKALRSTNTILKEIPTDQKALQCKAVCLIQTSKFPEALETIKQIEDQSGANILLWKTYALYRTSRYTEIVNMLNHHPGELPLELRELKAQTLYKLERYEESLELYKELLKKQRDDLDSERQCNYLAVLTQLQMQKGGNVGNFTPSAFETYELFFNAAALDMAKGNYADAEQKLRKAEALFRATAEEDQLPSHKLKSELCTVKSQLLQIQLQKARKIPIEKPAGFNVEAIENNFLNQFAKLKKKKKEAEVASPKGKPSGKTAAGDIKKKRHKRKPRLPKNYDPTAKPDPERWLPKYERSTYKKKKVKGGNVMKGTQGSTAAEPIPAAPPTPKTQHVQAGQPQGPRQSKPQAAAKKQAKKRRK